MAIVSLEYLAGLCDGEAWIGITQGHLRIEIQMADRALIEKLYIQYGGGFQKCTHRKLTQRFSFRWTITGRKAVELLTELLPFLVVKNAQAEIGIMWGVAKEKKDLKQIQVLQKQISKLNSSLKVGDK